MNINKAAFLCVFQNTHKKAALLMFMKTKSSFIDVHEDSVNHYNQLSNTLSEPRLPSLPEVNSPQSKFLSLSMQLGQELAHLLPSIALKAKPSSHHVHVILRVTTSPHPLHPLLQTFY